VRRDKIQQIRGQTGSPQQGEPVFLAIGHLRRSHGITGEIILSVLTDFPERFNVGKVIYWGDEHLPLKIRALRPIHNNYLIAFENYHTPEAAQQLRNTAVYVRSDEIPDLPDGEFYLHKLLGVEVYNVKGDKLGQVEEIIETGANDVYLVRMVDGQELLLPAIDSVIKSIDLPLNRMIVIPPEWL
jgi:16S rRNA processing protein RimM